MGGIGISVGDQKNGGMGFGVVEAHGDGLVSVSEGYV